MKTFLLGLCFLNVHRRGTCPPGGRKFNSEKKNKKNISQLTAITYPKGYDNGDEFLYIPNDYIQN